MMEKESRQQPQHHQSSASAEAPAESLLHEVLVKPKMTTSHVFRVRQRNGQDHSSNNNSKVDNNVDHDCGGGGALSCGVAAAGSSETEGETSFSSFDSDSDSSDCSSSSSSRQELLLQEPEPITTTTVVDDDEYDCSSSHTLEDDNTDHDDHHDIGSDSDDSSIHFITRPDRRMSLSSSSHLPRSHFSHQLEQFRSRPETSSCLELHKFVELSTRHDIYALRDLLLFVTGTTTTSTSGSHIQLERIDSYDDDDNEDKDDNEGKHHPCDEDEDESSPPQPPQLQLQSSQQLPPLRAVRLTGDQWSATSFRRWAYKKDNILHHIQKICKKHGIELDFQIQLHIHVPDLVPSSTSANTKNSDAKTMEKDPKRTTTVADAILRILHEVEKHPEIRHLQLDGHVDDPNDERVIVEAVTTLLNRNDRDWEAVTVNTTTTSMTNTVTTSCGQEHGAVEDTEHPHDEDHASWWCPIGNLSYSWDP